MFRLPRGTRDFTPEDMEKRRYVEENISRTFKSYGYREIQTPMFETLELFTAKSGEEIIDEIYAFSDKGGRKLALRPELTAPVIRFYVDKQQMEPKPLKLFYFGNCFRYDRPQKGRYREFRQAGCEMIGADTPEAYAELIALAYTILKNVGVKNIELNIGNLDILASMFIKIGVSKNEQKKITPLIDKSMFDDVSQYLNEIGVSKDDVKGFTDTLQTPDINKVKEFIRGDDSALDALTKLEEILHLLRNRFKIKDFNIKMSIVRGLEYYKGLVFEIDAPRLGAEKQLCGGGAYDLVKLFGGTDVSTAGFAIGFDRTILTLEQEGFVFPRYKTDVYVIPVTEETIGKSIEIAQDLRKEGFSTDIDLLRRGISKSLKYANSKNVKKAVLVGPRELKENSVTLRDMETGEQTVVEIPDLTSKLKK